MKIKSFIKHKPEIKPLGTYVRDAVSLEVSPPVVPPSKISIEANQSKKSRPHFGSFMAVFMIVFMLFALTMTVSLVSERTSLFGKAQVSISTSRFSPENSYVFASPLSALANGQEKIRVSVFLLNTEGLGVSGKRAFLGQTVELKVKEVQPISDSLGRALFDVSSTKKGEYYIEVGADSQVLPQKARITFR